MALLIVRSDVFHLRYFNRQIRPDFYLKSGENLPKRLSIFQFNVIQRKAHQILTVYGYFEVGFGKRGGNLERLIEDEWEFSRMNLRIAPARTLRKFKKKLEGKYFKAHSSSPSIELITTSC